MRTLTLSKTVDIERRLDVLKLRIEKAEAKVVHADTFRQRNMNYALLIFGGLIGLRANMLDPTNQIVISTTLLILSIVFCVWDRRWHRTKHGWDATSGACFTLIVELTNNEKQDVTFPVYDTEAEEEAEWRSWQPIVFYLLVLGSIASFFIEVAARLPGQ